MPARHPGSENWGHPAAGASKSSIASPVVLSSFGIGARLSIAFVAVAVLAIAAHMFARGGTTIIRMETVTTAPAALVSSATASARAYQSANALLAALHRFDRAVLGRLDAPSQQNAAELQAARAELDRAHGEYVAAAAQWMDSARLRELEAQLAAQKKRGRTLEQLAERRRAALREYWDRFEALDAQLKKSLDQSWKIFGRLLARQSLVTLSRSLDDIRQHFMRFRSVDSYDQSAIDSILRSEYSFAEVLDRNASGLRRSLGAEWVTNIRADFERIVVGRDSLLRMDEQRRRDARVFSNVSAAISGMLSVAPRGSLPRPAVQTNASTGQQSTGAHNPVAAGALTPDSSGLTSSTTTHESLASRPDSNRKFVGIAAVVLVLLLALSVGTVLSVQRPVRRLMEATDRLAKGETHVRVPRGGIRELDALAVAFNGMAEQLASARAAVHVHQSQLEAKVDERTRQLQHLAEHDPLTHLPNRRQLFAYLDTALRGAAGRGECVAVFFLDLDNFKTINDSLGHEFGDGVLQAIGQRLHEAVHGHGFTARLGGDEFTVIWENAGDLEQIREAGMSLVRAFHEPLAIGERELLISVSIGASIYPDHATGAEALLRAADAALFRAKELGRSQLNIFSPDLLEAASSRFRVEQGLRRAVEREEFELVYQPVIDLETLEVASVEALIRWRLPEGRLASPGEFLEVAEQSGLITEISDWVLRSAISQAAEWHHGVWPKARVAVNMSSRELLDNRFADRMEALLVRHRLPAKCMEIELTENVLQTGGTTVAALKRLRAAGVAIALDDFGAGYSSLASLEELPLTRVKLDRSLIAGIDHSARSVAISRAIIGLCHDLNLSVTAEGIERCEQLAALAHHRRLMLQGYLFAKPMSREQIPAFLAAAPAQMQSLLVQLHTGPREIRTYQSAAAAG
jgi:diguanylate cyclase (GGDEF)-like protein